jgi:large subunit ribosomal protein L29
VKSKELRALTAQEIQEKLDQTHKTLFELRVRATTKELENTSDIKKERRNVARMKQALAEKQKADSAGQKA